MHCLIHSIYPQSFVFDFFFQRCTLLTPRSHLFPRLQDGPSLYGDTVSATYDFTGIDDDRSQPASHLIENAEYGLLHPLSKEVHQKSIKSIPTSAIPILQRKASERDMKGLCAAQSPVSLFQMLCPRFIFQPTAPPLLIHPTSVALSFSKGK